MDIISADGRNINKDEFIQRRENDIAFFVKNGFTVHNQAHLADGGIEVKRSIKESTVIQETFCLEGDLLWTLDAFVKNLGCRPEDAGYVLFSKELPDGHILEGYRTPRSAWSGQLPLEGVTPIKKDVVVKVGSEKKTKQSEDMDDAQFKAHMQLMAKRSFGSSNDKEAVGLQALLSLKQNRDARGETHPASSDTLKPRPKTPKGWDEETDLFDPELLSSGAPSGSAGQRQPTATPKSLKA